MSGKTLSQKVWERHVVHSDDSGSDLLFIDLHLVHEVTSPQAFDSLRMADRPVLRPAFTVATEDPPVPTTDTDKPIADPISRKQIETLRSNCSEFGIRLFSMGDQGQGIVHVIGPEMGLTLPGMTVVCGDSHTSTHGAFGALAFGIGTSVLVIFCYYAFIKFGQTLGYNGVLIPITSAWLGNIIFTICGLLLLLKAKK